ncbi:hypothetical protein PF008_g17286 [Phytophthora fragariae]|uniref:Uncharacterized protein n=1 Tax=Phytophthora fragariae TaxID=53985 RepID=A0A6G0R8Q3_9STRA|nr:hypothetical protein PF008_g17286 [Phytophthora fragariae]
MPTNVSPRQMSKIEAGTWATAGAGNVLAPSLGTGRVTAPSAGVYYIVEAVCSVEATRGVAALTPAAAVNCRSAAGIGVSGAEAPDTASSVLAVAGSMGDVPASLDVVLTLPDPEVAVDMLLETAESTLDVVGMHVELPMTVDAAPGAMTPTCAVSAVVVG